MTTLFCVALAALILQPVLPATLRAVDPGSTPVANERALASPEPMSSGEPTLEPAAGTVTLTGSGWSFGMCMGFCNADLKITRGAVSLAARDRDVAVPLFVNQGWLTPEALVRLEAATRGIDRATLESVYGCPDCADGGAAYLELASAGVTSRHEMEFGRPPDELADAYAIAVAMMSALETCADTDLVTVADDCSPYPPA